MKKRLFAIFLSLCLAAMLLPAAVFAADPTVTVTLTLDGGACTGRTVTLRSAGGTLFTGLTEGPDGIFTVPQSAGLAAGTYKILVDGTDTGRTLAIAAGGAAETLRYYTVTFHADGGTPAPASQIVLENGLAAAPAAVSKAGFHFTGWYTDAALTAPWSFTASRVTGTTTLYARYGGLTVTGSGWSYAGDLLTINQSGTCTIAMAPGVTKTTDRIVVKSGIRANITLAGVDIDLVGTKDDASANRSKCAFDMTGATVALTLADGTVNTLRSGGARAGLEVPAGAALTIAGRGTLNAESRQYDGGTPADGGGSGAGIGGAAQKNGGTITISSGVVNAVGAGGAAIGGGSAASGGTLTIAGGTVTCTHADSSDPAGALIGGGGSDNAGGSGGTVVLRGGKVTAVDSAAAAIGGGAGGGSGAAVTISGGTLTAGSQSGSAIGAGPQGSAAAAGAAGKLTAAPGTGWVIAVSSGTGAAVAAPASGSPFAAQTDLTALVKGAQYVAASASMPIKEQFALTPGGTYWFDLSAAGIPGTASDAAAVPDPTLTWVPFTWAGTVNAYSLGAAAAGDTAAADKAVLSPRSLFTAAFTVTRNVSWDALNSGGFIFGKAYASGGVTYTLRAPSAGSSTDSGAVLPAASEWDALLAKNSASLPNWQDSAAWGQDTAYADAASRAVRGSSAADGWSMLPSAQSALPDSGLVGFRPVLAVPGTLAANALKVMALDLNGGRLTTGAGYTGAAVSSMNIIYTGTACKAPSSAKFTRPDGDTGSWFAWKGSDGKFYEPGAQVPAAVTALTAQWVKPVTTTTTKAPTTTAVRTTAKPTAATTAAPTGTLPVFTITTSAGPGGSFSTGKTVTVHLGESAGFTITPDSGYEIADVKVDGKSIGAKNTYVFTNITANHTLSASFQKKGAAAGTGTTTRKAVTTTAPATTTPTTKITTQAPPTTIAPLPTQPAGGKQSGGEMRWLWLLPLGVLAVFLLLLLVKLRGGHNRRPR